MADIAHRLSSLNFSTGDLIIGPETFLTAAHLQTGLDLISMPLAGERRTVPGTDPDPGMLYWGTGHRLRRIRV